jgi:hypothetical protein
MSPRNTKTPRPTKRDLPTQEPIPLHIERHIERPLHRTQPAEPPKSRVIVISLVDEEDE